MLRSTHRGRDALAGVMMALASVCAAQAQPKPAPLPAPPPAAPSAAAPSTAGPSAAGPSAAAPTPAAPAAEWGSFPTMLLEKIYRGPMRDTVIQRWRDPIDGSVCYVYLPISAPMLSQPAEGYMQYGPNQIGSISCIHPTQVLQLWQGGSPPPVPAPSSRTPASRH